jgi:hypothetical protein
MGSGCGYSTCGLRTHLFQHFRFHFLHRGLSFVGSHHPCVSVRIHDDAAPITPKHIDHRALACGSEVESFGDRFVHVFCVDNRLAGEAPSATAPTNWQGCMTRRGLLEFGSAPSAGNRFYRRCALFWKHQFFVISALCVL